MGLYENVKSAAKEKGYSINRLEKELGFARSYVSKFRSITPSADKIQKIADFLDVSSEYLLTGENISKSVNNQLTKKDERDIAKDMEAIRAKLLNGADGPLSYDGEPIPKEDAELLLGQIELMIRRLKPINKEKYNPNKNKK